MPLNGIYIYIYIYSESIEVLTYITWYPRTQCARVKITYRFKILTAVDALTLSRPRFFSGP